MSMPYDSKLIAILKLKLLRRRCLCSFRYVLAQQQCPIRADRSNSTIDLRVDYMRPATPSQKIGAIATCYNLTKSVAFVRAVALDHNEEKRC